MASIFGDDGDDTLIDGDDDVIIDAAGGDIYLKDSGNTFGRLTNSGGNLRIKNVNTNVVTFSNANTTLEGNLTVSGYVTSVPLGAETIVGDDGSAAASPTVPVTFIYTNEGSSNISLADGGSYPLRKLFYLGLGGVGESAIITPDNLGGASNVTLSATADRVELLWIPSPGSTWTKLWSEIA